MTIDRKVIEDCIKHQAGGILDLFLTEDPHTLIRQYGYPIVIGTIDYAEAVLGDELSPWQRRELPVQRAKLLAAFCKMVPMVLEDRARVAALGT